MIKTRSFESSNNKWNCYSSWMQSATVILLISYLCSLQMSLDIARHIVWVRCTFLHERAELKFNLSCFLQNMDPPAYLFIRNQRFIGFLHKQNWAVLTDESSYAWWSITCCLQFRGNSNIQNFITFRSRWTLAQFKQACGRSREILKFWNAAISKYILLIF